MSRSSTRGKAVVALGCIIFAGGTFSIPYFIRTNTENINKRDKLTSSQRQRGMYYNQGQDAGIDPDWDPLTHTWNGFDKKSTKQPDSSTKTQA